MAKKKQTIRCKECVAGEIVIRQGFFSLTGKCPKCNGVGHVPKPSATEALKDRLLH